MAKNSFTVALDSAQQNTLSTHLKEGNYTLVEGVPYARIAADSPQCRIVLYTSGKCVAQGRGAEEWITFVLEPQILGEARLGYEAVHNPDAVSPHMGIDESGKGDFFGPMVIAAVYTDEKIAGIFQRLGVRDSKTVTSDRKIEELAKAIIKEVGARYALITIGPRAYNRLYASMHSVNKILAWGHARAIENLLEKVPGCPRAVADQFGPEHQIKNALLKQGRSIELVQRHKAESDPAVAAASILARNGFVQALKKMGSQYGMTVPKGASEQVRAVAVNLVQEKGPGILLEAAKCHFKTTDQVLTAAGHARAALGPDGAAVSKDFTYKPRKEPKP